MKNEKSWKQKMHEQRQATESKEANEKKRQKEYEDSFNRNKEVLGV